MADHALEQLVEQIEHAIGKYQTHVSAEDKNALMLSGMSLVSNFLVRCDGHPQLTPHLLLKAVTMVAEKRGLAVGRLTEET